MFGQRFDPSGAAQGTEFRVNSYTTGTQREPVVGSDADGDFVVVWESFAQDSSGADLFGQRYDASGAAHGGEFRVNAQTTIIERAPSVSSDAGGNFVVVWESQDGSDFRVLGQRFAPLPDLIFKDGF